MNRMTIADLTLMYNLRQNMLSNNEIAKIIGCTYTTVYNHIGRQPRRNYKHLRRYYSEKVMNSIGKYEAVKKAVRQTYGKAAAYDAKVEEGLIISIMTRNSVKRNEIYKELLKSA